MASNETPLSSFTCATCKKPLYRKVYICDNYRGHSNCERCKSSKNCGVCSERIRSQRNHIVEVLLSKLKFPCQFANLGCTENLRSNNYYNHHRTCMHRTYKCHFCVEFDWSGTLNQLSRHLSADHRNKELYLDAAISLDIIVLPSENKILRRFVIFDKNIFYLIIKCVGDTIYFYFQINKIGTIKYIYTITLVDPQNPKTETFYKGTCVDLTRNSINVINRGRCFSISRKSYSQFSIIECSLDEAEEAQSPELQ